jgi:electron transfer flavoprotein beta subunit
MRVLVCVKRVPDTGTGIRIAEDGRSIDSSGVKYVMSPYDEYAVEAGLRVRDEVGGEVVLLTFGPEEDTEVLRKGLAMGADRAVLLRGSCTSDGLATAKVLADALRPDPPDLLLFGLKAADHDQGQVGPMVAALLNRPCATAVSHFGIQEGLLRCEREIDGGNQILTLPIGSVLTITKGPFEPRHPSLKGIMAAKGKPIETRDVRVVPPAVSVLRLEPPPERSPGKVVGEGADAVSELVRLLREEARVL